ncbi:hypothetical protein CANTEDRAFT_112220 [Yamadazyma tenuis ATCC 10573]|uniref:Uncharacterized protein n=1 Tax=Candida tenuis (strain ATCC 10573 / BCRC 21748 / CBS 615 / JCM 9827 / NBRC 10315 / NRRL Y-1498 / VKM Y-70) TaxID=590646 RepID=G3AWB5_CANTC|nr:uncharacterized protein CANTEDRAFT_112220 [Yamadazyma tenuis ATCC 10573]EGV66504.1 hypothetical protein CANTEDRAFT_112220 [Yamadazyma tenuis ATCC 10573]
MSRLPTISSSSKIINVARFQYFQTFMLRKITFNLKNLAYRVGIFGVLYIDYIEES